MSKHHQEYLLEHAQARRFSERRQLRSLAQHWRKEAAGFHSMGRKMVRELNMAGHEYLQTAAAFRACATQLESQLRASRIT